MDREGGPWCWHLRVDIGNILTAVTDTSIDSKLPDRECRGHFFVFPRCVDGRRYRKSGWYALLLLLLLLLLQPPGKYSCLEHYYQTMKLIRRPFLNRSRVDTH